MPKFKVGDVIKCIDPTVSDDLLTLWHNYTIIDVEKSGLFVRLKELPSPMGVGWWSIERFEQTYGPSLLNKAGIGLIEPVEFAHMSEFGEWPADKFTTELNEAFKMSYLADWPKETGAALGLSYNLAPDPEEGKVAEKKEWIKADLEAKKKSEKEWEPKFQKGEFTICENHKLRLHRVVEVEPGRGTLWFQCPNCKAGLNVISDIDGIEWPSYVEFVGLLKKVEKKVEEEEELTFRLIRI